MSVSAHQKSFANAVNEAIVEAMAADPDVICYGLGVTDPKGVFGTTSGLEAKFGPERVFDVPTSEGAMTGVAIGAALAGIKPVVTHQRADFFLLAMDQLINGAAKWHYMFGGQYAVPMTVRLILGRGWGQGPTHSQNLQALFAHIPGLKVVMPTMPQDAKDLLYSSIMDPNPVVFLEHRWLHESIGAVSDKANIVPLGKARLSRKGKDVTIVAMSYLTVEAQHAADYLQERGVSAEVIDLVSVKPIDWDAIFTSVQKTGRLLVLDTGFTTGSVAGEIVSRVAMDAFSSLRAAPQRLAMPDVPEPTSFALTKGFYVRASDVAIAVQNMFGNSTEGISTDLAEPDLHDVPGDWFQGPF